MHNQVLRHVKNLLLPCAFFSVLTGVVSALYITAFKEVSELVIKLSQYVYAAVRENPAFLPLLLLGAAAIGFIASILLSLSHSAKGGGIPTSVAAIRGIITFRWIKSLFFLPISALLSFAVGVPLGTEGPCVQMGTAVGDGVIKCIGGQKQRGWRRYVMTGGASAGFTIATASPVTAILFSIEELHKHFSPLMLTVVSISVVSAQATANLLSLFGIGSGGLFEIPTLAPLDLKLLFVPLAVGTVAGIAAILFTRLYHFIDGIMHTVLKKLPLSVVLPILFGVSATVGFFLSEANGTGHALVDTILNIRSAWYLLILIFVVRAIGMILSNTSGATGGIFLPTLAFGAIIGALCAEAMIALGLIGEEHYLLTVVLGITAFLGATSRIPLTACVFAIEALNGGSNVLSIIISTVIALLVVESSGLEDFTDIVINARLKKLSKGKSATVVEASLKVGAGAFVVGKEIHDVLWPNQCVVISFERAEGNKHAVGIAEGDVITVHYKTYDTEATAEEFEALVGKQSDRNIFEA